MREYLYVGEEGKLLVELGRGGYRALHYTGNLASGKLNNNHVCLAQMGEREIYVASFRVLSLASFDMSLDPVEVSTLEVGDFESLTLRALKNLKGRFGSKLRRKELDRLFGKFNLLDQLGHI